MEEKVLVEAKFYKFPGICTAVIALYSLFVFVVSLADHNDEVANVYLALTFVFAIITAFYFGFLSRMSFVVTNKRVYGTGMYRSRIELPIEHISAIACWWPKCIGVSTSSGFIRVFWIKNGDVVFSTLSKVVRKRKNQVVQQVSSADELLKFKELLDAGVITQEEFDAKKKQILGL